MRYFQFKWCVRESHYFNFIAKATGVLYEVDACTANPNGTVAAIADTECISTQVI